MGYLINPICFRVGFTRSWKDSWFLDNFHYSNFVYTFYIIRLYIKWFFSLSLVPFKKKGIIYSHLVFNKYYQSLDILVFFYDAYVQKILYNVENSLFRLNIDWNHTWFNYITSFDSSKLAIKTGIYIYKDPHKYDKLEDKFIPIDRIDHYEDLNKFEVLKKKGLLGRIYKWSPFELFTFPKERAHRDIPYFMLPKKKKYYWNLRIWKKRKLFIIKIFLLLVIIDSMFYAFFYEKLYFFVRYFWAIMREKHKGFYFFFKSFYNKFLEHTTPIYNFKSTDKGRQKRSFLHDLVFLNTKLVVSLIFFFVSFFEFYDLINVKRSTTWKSKKYIAAVRRFIVFSCWFSEYGNAFKIFKVYLTHKLVSSFNIQGNLVFFLVDNDSVNADFILTYITSVLLKGASLRQAISPIKKELKLLAGYEDPSNYWKALALMRIEKHIFKKVKTGIVFNYLGNKFKKKKYNNRVVFKKIYSSKYLNRSYPEGSLQPVSANWTGGLKMPMVHKYKGDLELSYNKNNLMFVVKLPKKHFINYLKKIDS